LKVLGAREDVLSDIFELAEQKLKDASKDSNKYASVLKGLIEEGLYGLMENSISVRARKADLEIAKTAADEASRSFEEKTKKNVTITVDENNFIPAES
jgi:V-type H+-transporting ATPase subunit E